MADAVSTSEKRKVLKAAGHPVGDRGKLSKEAEAAYDAYAAGRVPEQPQR